MRQFIDAVLKQGAEKGETYFQKMNQEEILFENSKLKQVSTKRLQGLTIQAVKNGKVGTLASSDLSQPDRLASKALELANFGDTLTYDFNTPAASYPTPEMSSEKVYDRATEELINDVEAMITKIQQYEKNVQMASTVTRTTIAREIINSHGMHATSTQYSLTGYGYAFLVEGDNFVGLYEPADDKLDFQKVADNLIAKLKLARNTVTMESGKYPVILTPNAVAQLTYALAGFNGQNIAKGISPIKDKLNTQIFDEKITLIDDGTLAYGFGTAPFDDEGTPTQRTVLVEDGVLKGFIHNLKSAEEAKTRTTGNGWKPGRAYQRGTNCEFSNIIFAPGNTSFEEMLSSIKEGIMIEDFSGLMMGNVIQGNIDSDIDMAFKIENGKLVGRVKNGAIGNNVYQMLKNNVLAVENKVHALNMGYGAYVPHILLKDIFITIG